jgi:hypothetical protein
MAVVVPEICLTGRIDMVAVPHLPRHRRSRPE